MRTTKTEILAIATGYLLFMLALFGLPSSPIVTGTVITAILFGVLCHRMYRQAQERATAKPVAPQCA